jgi:hypothetical protein
LLLHGTQVVRVSLGNEDDTPDRAAAMKQVMCDINMLLSLSTKKR